MQYYVKIFNKSTNEIVGYYKDTGRNCITKLPKGMKYFNTVKDALRALYTIDEGFIRDRDGKYYTGHAVICGDHTREPRQSIYRNTVKESEDYKDEITAFIRQNSRRSFR